MITFKEKEVSATLTLTLYFQELLDKIHVDLIILGKDPA